MRAETSFDGQERRVAIASGDPLWREIGNSENCAGIISWIGMSAPYAALGTYDLQIETSSVHIPQIYNPMDRLLLS